MVAGQRLSLPMEEERAVYIAEGRIRVGSESVGTYEMAVLNEGVDIEIYAETDSRIALIGGERLGQRFIDWNFVSSRRERIELARAQWRNREFPLVPGDEEEFIPLPD